MSTFLPDGDVEFGGKTDPVSPSFAIAISVVFGTYDQPLPVPTQMRLTDDDRFSGD